MNNIISSSNTAQHHYYHLLCLIFIFICYINDICKTSTLLKVANVTMFLHRRGFSAKKWFDTNKLSLNVSKTKIMLFGNCKSNNQVQVQTDGVNINTFLVCSAHLYICIYW